MNLIERIGLVPDQRARTCAKPSTALIIQNRSRAPGHIVHGGRPACIPASVVFSFVYYNEHMIKKYKMIVIGAGSGGLTAAEVAAKFGAKVALIEASEALGGECLHTGCVPSKVLIHAARTAWRTRQAESIGIQTSVSSIDYSKVKAHMQSAINTIQHDHDSDAFFQALGVDVFHGKASFADDRTILVGDQWLTADKIIISTGSRPLVPNIEGLKDGPFLTNETIFELDELPKSLVVIGGGPIGCELGQAFAMLGTTITILQSAPRLLPRDDETAVVALADSLKAMGVTVYTDSRITKVSYDQEGMVTVTTETGEVHAQKLLIATGRSPTIPEGAEKAGVKLNEKGIIVNDQLRTSNPRIYAVGDCNGIIQLTHTAAEQASSAVQNALYFQKKTFALDTVSWTTFTTPEIAQYGKVFSAQELEKHGYELHKFTYDQLDRAVAEQSKGFGKIITDKKGRIIGATIAGEQAGELLGQFKTAGTVDRIAEVTQPYPTYASGVWQVGSNIAIDRIKRRSLGKLLRFFSR